MKKEDREEILATAMRFLMRRRYHEMRSHLQVASENE
jgi:hypothetical protein